MEVGWRSITHQPTKTQSFSIRKAPKFYSTSLDKDIKEFSQLPGDHHNALAPAEGKKDHPCHRLHPSRNAERQLLKR
jgi:hypothetical protein